MDTESNIKDDHKLKAAETNEELETELSDDELDPSLGSLADEDLGNESIQGDTWIEELECALLADCDPATLKKISEGRSIPAVLRPDYWRALLALNDTGKVKLNHEYNLENQVEIRHDCELLVEDIDTNLSTEPLTDGDKLRLRSDFESTLTTYVKARPELSYIPENGWTDILRVLYHLNLSDTQLYQMFFRIVDRYVPKDLSHKSPTKLDTTETSTKNSTNKPADETTSDGSEFKVLEATTTSQQATEKRIPTKSIQAYHLLRLLIQYHDPELCSILDSNKIIPNLYVKDWFCSLFARSCSPKLALCIWDTHFKMADPFLIFFAAIVMVVNASDELKKSNLSQEEMLKVLKATPSQLTENDIEDLYYLVSNHYTNSTPRSIRTYSHLFFMDTFGNTYLGNESPEEGQQLVDLKTTQLTSKLDLSHYLCLPIVPAEIFALDTAQVRSSPTNTISSLKYFLVDCRPAEQYNSGHLAKAFHLDCSLMLREPSSFKTAVQALLAIQRQVVASKSNTGGQHLCFIGSGPGHEEEDQYVNMVVASFLQKCQKYVSIVVGGFDAIHDYVATKSELRDSFNKYIVDHEPTLCKACLSRMPEAPIHPDGTKRGNQSGSGGASLSSAQSLFANKFNKLTSNPNAAATANLIAQSGATMFDKFTTAFVSKSSVIKDRLVETLNTTYIPATTLSTTASPGRGHVSDQDRLGKRYTGSNLRYAIDDDEFNNRGGKRNGSESSVEPVQEIQIDHWQKQVKTLAFHKCAQIIGNSKYPGYVALTKTHMWILREIPHNKGFASIAAKRPLDMVVKITSKRRQPDLIIFRYGDANQNQQSATNDDSSDSSKNSKGLPNIVDSDNLHIPQAFELIRLIKREIVRIMDENSRANSQLAEATNTTATTSTSTNITATNTNTTTEQEKVETAEVSEESAPGKAGKEAAAAVTG